jgi:hypothetical protein
MKILPVEPELFRADRWTDRQTDRHGEGRFLQCFANAPKN